MNFKEIEIKNTDFNPIRDIENSAMLTCGEIDNYNMMTITGFLCGKLFLRPSVMVYVHPDRYTYGFMESNEIFSVSFFDQQYKEALRICGSTHGNECDKASLASLTPRSMYDTVVFEEAKIVFICEKIYHADIESELFDSKQVFNQYYKKENQSYHRLYLGQITKVLMKE